ncbi:class Ib ribonucleoside-diphosphate reductase assembly flavoprotein NrdI [Paenibacillus yanchengensis]|uniref:Protein NrdI n=1 Tax=Paenibacillus yanchengensis TaxID=2035833 RepID=A0ABW4YKY4_9BACL
MLIVYESRTGNVRRFISKLKMRAVSVDEQSEINEPFVMVTYTTGFGQVPPKVDAFLERNAEHLRGVSASGNRNWGNRFAQSADYISEKYDVPVILKFELSGTVQDTEHFVERVQTIETY